MSWNTSVSAPPSVRQCEACLFSQWGITHMARWQQPMIGACSWAGGVCSVSCVWERGLNVFFFNYLKQNICLLFVPNSSQSRVILSKHIWAKWSLLLDKRTTLFPHAFENECWNEGRIFFGGWISNGVDSATECTVPWTGIRSTHTIYVVSTWRERITIWDFECWIFGCWRLEDGDLNK